MQGIVTWEWLGLGGIGVTRLSFVGAPRGTNGFEPGREGGGPGCTTAERSRSAGAWKRLRDEAGKGFEAAMAMWSGGLH